MRKSYILINILLSIFRSGKTCELRFVECKDGDVYIQVTQLRKGETIDMDKEMGSDNGRSTVWSYQDG